MQRVLGKIKKNWKKEEETHTDAGGISTTKQKKKTKLFKRFMGMIKRWGSKLQFSRVYAIDLHPYDYMTLWAIL